MKKLFFALLFITALASTALAAGYTVEWGYTPPSSPAVTGYVLYKGEVKVTTFTGAATRSGTVATGTLVEGEVFTLTAAFADGTESGASAPFTWHEGPKILRLMPK